MATIPLMVQPPQVPQQDWAKTFLTISQIRDQQQQAALRGLQAQQLQQQMAEIPVFQRLMAQGPGGGMAAAAPSPSGAEPPPGSYAALRPGVASPQEAPQPATAAAPQGGLPFKSVSLPQGPFPTPGAPPMPAGPTSSSAAGAPPLQAGGPAGTAPMPQQPPAPPPQQRSWQDDVAARGEMYRQLAVQTPYLWQRYGETIMNTDKHSMEMQRQALENQKLHLGLMNELLGAVQDAPMADRPNVYSEAVQALQRMNIPGAQQLPPTWSPQAEQRIQAARQMAQTVQQRQEQRNKELEDSIKAFEAQTNRIKSGTEQFTAQTGRIQAQTEAYKTGYQGTETEYKETPQGLVATPKYPGGMAALGGQAGAQPVTVNGQPVQSLQAMQATQGIEHGLYQQHMDQSANMKEASLAMSTLRQSLTPPKGQENANDTGLLTNFFKLMNPQNPRDVQQGRTNAFELTGAVGDRIKRMWTRVSEGGALDAADRHYLGQYAEKIYGQQSQDYEQNVLGPNRARASQYPNVNPALAAPDVRTSAPGYQPKVVTSAEIQQLAKRAGKSPEQVMQDVQAKGYQVLR